MLFSRKTLQSLILSAAFAIAMAYLEAAVVVYLRKIYYPDGFHFPLVDVSRSILLIEIGREVATIIMLYAAAKMLAVKRQELISYFLYTFGIWDIFYYVWLKILLNWPSSLLDWDVLFLIPLPWLGPILAPLLISLSFITASLVILRYESTEHPLRFNNWEIVCVIISAVVIIISFLTELKSIILVQPPQHYHWFIFTAGLALSLVIFIRKIVLHRPN